jgi:exopolyphosphatase / guanosine-5'-triphosphate,3'-diphosphate pyrophosphatase
MWRGYSICQRFFMAGGLIAPVEDGTAGPQPSVSTSRAPSQLFAALDLGTNNCRLLIAQRVPGGFRVVDSFSRIVRLGDGLGATGRLSDAAMKRTLDAIAACAEKLKPHQPLRMRCVATQACRVAKNGRAFLRDVAKQTGIKFDIIPPSEEARLAVVGCADLFDHRGEGALVVDIGGGSTELSWALNRGQGRPPKLEIWFSAPIGVVTLAELHPERADTRAWYDEMKQGAVDMLTAFDPERIVAQKLHSGVGHIIGTSGAVTSLAGVHLKLTRYARRLVDGIWISKDDTYAAINLLASQDRDARALNPCIGPERADLVLAGAAILDAVLEMWPSPRLRVADRGLREGLILTMLQKPKRRKKRSKK